MTAEQFIKAELAALCWREGGHLGGLDILLALGCVFRNRVRAGWRGGEWLEVMYSADEYTAELRNCGIAELSMDLSAGAMLANALDWSPSVRAEALKQIQLRVEKHNGESITLPLPCQLAQVVEYVEVSRPKIDLRDPTVRLFMGQVDDIFNGLLDDRWTVNDSAPSGALFYAELNAVTRDWFKKNILARPEEHPRVAVVGSMTFFR